MTNIYRNGCSNHCQAAQQLAFPPEVKDHTKKNTFVMSLTFSSCMTSYLSAVEYIRRRNELPIPQKSAFTVRMPN
jgi:hypothetical protein